MISTGLSGRFMVAVMTSSYAESCDAFHDEGMILRVFFRVSSTAEMTDQVSYGQYHSKAAMQICFCLHGRPRWQRKGNRVEVPEIISAKQRCFWHFTFFSAVQRWFREHAKYQRWSALFQTWSVLIFSESALFRTENFSAKKRCFRKRFWKLELYQFSHLSSIKTTRNLSLCYFFGA